MVDRGTATQIPEIRDQDVLARLHSVMEYGYGRVEIIVRAGKVSTVNHTFSLVRKPDQFSIRGDGRGRY